MFVNVTTLGKVPTKPAPERGPRRAPGLSTTASTASRDRAISKRERNWRLSQRYPTPLNWPELRLDALAQAHYSCELRLLGCRKAASDVIPLVGREDFRPENLVATCLLCSEEHWAALELQELAERAGPPSEPEPAATSVLRADQDQGPGSICLYSA